MSRVFVGNLPMDVKERELDDLFYKYGRIRDIDIKMQTRPPAFAFITFDDSRDAEDAVRGRDGYEFAGSRLRCEMSRGSRDVGGGRGRDSFRDREREAPRSRPAGRRTEFRVLVTGLPRSASWQDLKDFMRKAGDVIFTDVDGHGGGTVEFSNPDDMDNAVRKLDDTEFKNPYDRSYIRVKYDKKSGARSVSRSRSRSVSVSRSRSRDRKRSYSRSRSASPERRDDDKDEESNHVKVDEDASRVEESNDHAMVSEEGNGAEDTLREAVEEE